MEIQANSGSLRVTNVEVQNQISSQVLKRVLVFIKKILISFFI